MNRPPTPTAGDEPSMVLDALVAQALDDLDHGHLGRGAALRALARAAWTAGHQASPDPHRS